MTGAGSSLRRLRSPTPTLEVKLSDEESFTVRGLGLNDVLHIYRRRSGEMALAFDTLASSFRTAGAIDSTDVSLLLVKAIEEAPHVVAEAIALATGSDPFYPATFEEDVALAFQLPVGAQVAALERIAHLTFTSDMPPGKLFALVAKSLGTGQAIQGEIST